MPGAYFIAWVNPLVGFPKSNICEVYTPRVYSFPEQRGVSTATWDKWKVRGAWWSSKAKWTWIQAREVESYIEGANSLRDDCPRILSFEAASGQFPKQEPIPTHWPYWHLL